MGAKEAFERSFRELILTMPYQKITVTALCRKAHLSRKTFYDNFQDKEGVLEAIVHDSLTKPIATMNDLLTIDQARNMMDVFLELIYASIADDREFYQALVRPMKGVDDTFIRVVTHEIEMLNHGIIDRVTNVNAMERDYVAYFFASSQAMLIQKWLFDGMPLTTKQLAALYKKMGVGYWMSL